MTEAEWLASTDPTPMLEALRGKASDRKLILFSLGCWTTREWYAETEWDDEIKLQTELVLAGAEPLAKLICLFGAFNFAAPPTPDRWAEMVTRKRPDPTPTESVQASFLRDIFGNPFSPTAIDPSWLTSTVIAVARGVYADRAFDRMPILADALQDARCDDTDILSHCRSEGPHVRGCWVIDLILGNQ
jgi:hypothetical protein